MSEIEFCTLYVVPEQWIVGCMLRFVHANNHFSDTLIPIPQQRAADIPHVSSADLEAVAYLGPKGADGTCPHRSKGLAEPIGHKEQPLADLIRK